MTLKYSRGHWSQIVSRVKQAKFIFDEGWKCLICGKQFRGQACPHTVQENEAVISVAMDLAKSGELLNS